MFKEPSVDLKHFGVPGMKWGRRNSAPRTETTNSSRFNRLSSTIKKKYSEIDPKTIQIGKKLVLGTLAFCAAQVAVKYIVAPQIPKIFSAILYSPTLRKNGFVKTSLSREDIEYTEGYAKRMLKWNKDHQNQ
jgi:hypothetical protein